MEDLKKCDCKTIATEKSFFIFSFIFVLPTVNFGVSGNKTDDNNKNNNDNDFRFNTYFGLLLIADLVSGNKN